jgi:hypothetical protein
MMPVVVIKAGFAGFVYIRRSSMRGGRAFAVVLAAALAVLTLPRVALAQPAAAGACEWQLDTWLPLPAGYTGAEVAGAGGPEQFVGTAINAAADNDFRAVVWRGGDVSLLPTPAGSSSFAMGTNRRGDVVGVIFTSAGGSHGPDLPVLWRGDRLIELATPPGSDTSARAVNDAGLIVGDSTDQAGRRRAVAWSARRPGEVRRVRVAGQVAAIGALTERGIIAGTVVSTEPSGRTVGVAGTVAAGLHVLPELRPGDFTTIFAASGAYLAGVALGADGATAVQWHNGRPRALSASPAEALAVNSDGTATGNRLTDFHPLVWTAGVERELPLVAAGRLLAAGLGQVITEDGSTIGGIVTADGTPTQPVLWHCR